MAHLELEPLRHMGLLERGTEAGTDAGLPAHARRYGDFLVEWRPLEACGAIETEWRALAADAIEPNIFHEPDFLLAAARHLAEGAGYGAVLVWRAGPGPRVLLGLWPLRTAGIALKIARGFRSRYASSGAPLLHRQFAVESATAMLAFVLSRETPGTALMFPEMALEGPAARALRAAATLAAFDVAELGPHLRACIWQGEGPPQLASSRHSRHRQKASNRKLAQHGEVRHSCAEGLAVRQELELFLALEASGWKGRRGTAILADPRVSAFYRSMARALARDGKASVHLLECGARVVAAGLVLKSGGQAWFVKTAHDEEMAGASPGSLLAYRIGENLLADGSIALVDSCARPGSVTMERNWRGRIRIGDMLIAPPAALARAERREMGRRRLREMAKAAWYRFNGWPMA